MRTVVRAYADRAAQIRRLAHIELTCSSLVITTMTARSEEQRLSRDTEMLYAITPFLSYTVVQVCEESKVDITAKRQSA